MAWKMMTNHLAAPHHYDVCHQHTDPSSQRIPKHIIKLRDAESRNILGGLNRYREQERNQEPPFFLMFRYSPVPSGMNNQILLITPTLTLCSAKNLSA